MDARSLAEDPSAMTREAAERRIASMSPLEHLIYREIPRIRSDAQAIFLQEV